MKMRTFAREIANVQGEIHHESRKDGDFGQYCVDWWYSQRSTSPSPCAIEHTFLKKYRKAAPVSPKYFRRYILSNKDDCELLVTFGFYFM